MIYFPSPYQSGEDDQKLVPPKIVAILKTLSRLNLVEQFDLNDNVLLAHNVEDSLY
jgi:hypothetical protein